MRNLLNPKWLYIVNTAPILLLFFLASGEYNIIKTLLKPEIKELWAIYAITLGVLALLNFSYTTWLVINKKQTSVWYGVVALVGYIAYLYFYMWNAHSLIPWDIPNWMVSDNILLYGGTFLMPTLAFSLFIIIVKVTPGDKSHNTLFNFFGALAVPILFFLFYHLGMSLWRVIDIGFNEHFFIITFITGTVVFLFFLVRTIYILAIRKGEALAKYRLAWKIPITIALPLIGLCVNGGAIPVLGEKIEHGGIFGDFSNPWFFILAILNGILLCLPSLSGRRYRLALFFARAVTFSFTFYFFLVFLPFLPLSVIAIIAIGVGFLMLAPLMLFIVHVRDLYSDYTFLQGSFSKAIRFTALFGGLLVLPACVTAAYIHDRFTLNEALAHVYEPDYSKAYDIDENSLANTLDLVKVYKDRGAAFDFLESRKLPYLTSYFNWIVLDNMTLSDSKMQTIEKIFFGHSNVHVWNNDNGERDDVTISDLKHASKYDPAKQQWESTIDLELTNHQGDMAEYETTLYLPDGCWINDYYLYVGDRKEKGTLAEKKAATWVYSQITNENRDPGILFYTGGNRVAFKVFPFADKEVRKTGISFIHKEPVKLNIDGRDVQLGEAGVAHAPKVVEANNTTYIPAAEKAKLKKVKRRPYLHFIVDVSKGEKKDVESIEASMKKIIAESRYNSQPVVSFGNAYYSVTMSEKEDWKDVYARQDFRGGFFAEKAIRKVLYDSYNNTTDSFPVIILVSEFYENAIINKDFSDMKFAFPDNDVFYWSGPKGFKAFSLMEAPHTPIDSAVIPHKEVLAWEKGGKVQRYMRNDSLPEITLTGDVTVKDESIKPHDWQTGLAMQGEYLSQVLHPETTADTWLPQIRHSFASGIMSPHTSYMVVENEAQKAVLKKKQDLVLSGNPSLDIGEETQSMDEPGLIMLLGLFALFLVFRKKLQRRAL